MGESKHRNSFFMIMDNYFSFTKTILQNQRHKNDFLINIYLIIKVWVINKVQNL